MGRYEGMTSKQFQQRVQDKRVARMNRVDSWPKELRDLVNEYGFTIVDMLYRLGVTKPNQIRHVVEAILDEFSPTRGSYSRQGVRTEVVAHLKAVDE